MAATIAGWQAESPIRPAGTTKVATDDWPYIDLESPRVPSLHYLLAGLLALIVAHGARKVGLSGPVGIRDASNWHFFFLGAAFLLLEVQNISKASVVLGNTWQVNAVVISGILAMVLLANLIVATCPRLPTLAAYAALGLICVGLYAADLSRLAFLPIAAKAPAVAVLAGLPMLFSGIIFARSLAASVAKDRALGANILGALVGGLLQPITFVTGTRFLLLIVAGFYAAAFLTRRSRSPAPTPSPVAPAGGAAPRVRPGGRGAAGLTGPDDGPGPIALVLRPGRHGVLGGGGGPSPHRLTPRRTLRGAHRADSPPAPSPS